MWILYLPLLAILGVSVLFGKSQILGLSTSTIMAFSPEEFLRRK
jgi:hypothetical protein